MQNSVFLAHLFCPVYFCASMIQTFGSDDGLKKTKLCVLFGGVSSEHDISLLSANAILQHLDREKYDILTVGITKEGRWLYIPNWNSDMMENDAWIHFADAVPVTLSVDRTRRGLFAQNSNAFYPIDCVFPALHGFNGEDGTMQGLLEIAGIPFVGCDTAASAMSMDKAITKLIAANAGIAQADWLVLSAADLTDCAHCIARVEETFTYPLFVKPACTGSSVGVTKVKGRDTLMDALRLAAQFDTKILVEEFIDGREIETAVLGNEDAIVSGCGEILSAQEFYSFDAKYCDEASETRIPAELPPEISEQIRVQAKRVYHALGCTGLSRVDFFVKRTDGSIIFNEINTIPGFTSISMYPKLFSACGISFSALLDRLIIYAMSAYERKRKYR